MSISTLRSIITAAGGTPTQYNHVFLLRELITALGGTPTQYAVVPLLRQLITTAGGTPVSYNPTYLLRELVTLRGGTPATFHDDDLWAQVQTLGFAFDPTTLFSSGQSGALYKVSQAGSLWQDAAGTIPATALNDPVRRINDLSGNARHAIAGSDAARLLLKISGAIKWLECDGADDHLAAIFAMAQPWDRVSAIRRIAYAGGTPHIFGGANVNNNGLLFQSDVNNLSMFDGTVATTGAVAVGTDVVATERHDGANSRLAIDNAAYSTANTGTGAVGGVTIGASHDLTSFSNMRFYGMCQRTPVFSAGEITSLRTWAGALQGRSI
jgi:hypothetical protein